MWENNPVTDVGVVPINLVPFTPVTIFSSGLPLEINVICRRQGWAALECVVCHMHQNPDCGIIIWLWPQGEIWENEPLTGDMWGVHSLEHW
jgi:hypothetical protein